MEAKAGKPAPFLLAFSRPLLALYSDLNGLSLPGSEEGKSIGQ
jgi:hypothetical protein